MIFLNIFIFILYLKLIKEIFSYFECFFSMLQLKEIITNANQGLRIQSHATKTQRHNSDTNRNTKKLISPSKINFDSFYLSTKVLKTECLFCVLYNKLLSDCLKLLCEPLYFLCESLCNLLFCYSETHRNKHRLVLTLDSHY